MRKKPPPRENCEEVISSSQLLELIAGLRLRVEQLEKELFPNAQGILSPPPPRPRKGRKPKLDTEILLKRRMMLTAWLEQNWPRLSAEFRKAEGTKNPSVAIAALIAAKKDGIPGVFQPPFYDAPEQYVKELGDFLESGRFHRNPRNLAAAMAGLPELSQKRSFDICAAHPYKTAYMLQVYWDYMKRKFPVRLRELEKATTELDVKVVLSRSRTDDPVYLHLKENPGKVKEWLEAGKPFNPSSWPPTDTSNGVMVKLAGRTRGGRANR